MKNTPWRRNQEFLTVKGCDMYGNSTPVYRLYNSKYKTHNCLSQTNWLW